MTLIIHLITGLTSSYVYSRRGNKLLLVEGYSFYRQTSTTSNRARWLCATHYKKGCRAIVHTVGDSILSVRREHNHSPKVNWTIEQPHYQSISYNPIEMFY